MIQALIWDIGERKRAEEKIRRYQERLRTLALDLSLVQERERRRIAIDLHDHIGQNLAFSKMKLGALRESVRCTSLLEPLEEIYALVVQTIEDTRSLVFELSPPVLYELGLEAGLEWLAERVQDLISRLTLSEKVTQMSHPAQAIPRLGIPAYNYWNEALHGVARNGRATVFPQAIGMAATWDADLVQRIARVHSPGWREGHDPRWVRIVSVPRRPRPGHDRSTRRNPGAARNSNDPATENRTLPTDGTRPFHG